jgi:hypothetical protein
MCTKKSTLETHIHAYTHEYTKTHTNMCVCVCVCVCVCNIMHVYTWTLQCTQKDACEEAGSHENQCVGHRARRQSCVAADAVSRGASIAWRIFSKSAPWYMY